MRCEGWLRSAEKPWSRCSSSSFAMEHGPWLSELEQMRWQDPSCTCVLRCTNDNGCRPINHPICNGTQRWLLGEWVSGFPRGSRECREPMILCASLLLCWVYNSVSLYLIIQMNTWFATWLYMKISHFGQRSVSPVVLGCGSAPLLRLFYCRGGRRSLAGLNLRTSNSRAKVKGPGRIHKLQGLQKASAYLWVNFSSQLGKNALHGFYPSLLHSLGKKILQE